MYLFSWSRQLNLVGGLKKKKMALFLHILQKDKDEHLRFPT